MWRCAAVCVSVNEKVLVSRDVREPLCFITLLLVVFVRSVCCEAVTVILRDSVGDWMLSAEFNKQEFLKSFEFSCKLWAHCESISWMTESHILTVIFVCLYPPVGEPCGFTPLAWCFLNVSGRLWTLRKGRLVEGEPFWGSGAGAQTLPRAAVVLKINILFSTKGQKRHDKSQPLLFWY